MYKLETEFSVKGHISEHSQNSRRNSSDKIIKMDYNKNHENNTRLRKGREVNRKVSTSLLAHEVEEFIREPFITSGYRDADGITVRQCLASLFSLHNETVNIWSHLLATLAFLLHFWRIFAAQDIIGNPSVYPLICFAFGICVVFLSSSLAHLFCCMSWKARHTCFYIDYATISIFSLTAGQANFFYCRPLDKDASDLHKFPYLFLGISVSFSCMNMFLSCLSRHRFRKYRFVFRTLMYVFKFLFDISPHLARCGFGGGSSCSASIVFLFNRHVLCYTISGITNALRIPERLCPGLFDYFGHSHHFLHIFTIVGNYDAFTVAHTNMIDRANELSASPYHPTFFSTFGLLILLICVNTYIGVWFVGTWLNVEEEELMVGSKYMVVYKKRVTTRTVLKRQ